MLGMLHRSKVMILSAVLENKVECQPLRAFEMKMIQEEIGEGRKASKNNDANHRVGGSAPIRRPLPDRQGDC